MKTKVKSQNAWLSLSVLYCTVLYYSTKRDLRDAICFGLYLFNLGTEYEQIFNLKIPVVYAKGFIWKIFSQRHYGGKKLQQFNTKRLPASLPSSRVWTPITPLNISESTFLPPINGGQWDTEENEKNQRTMIVEGNMRKVSVLIFLIRRKFHRGTSTGTFSNIITKRLF